MKTWGAQFGAKAGWNLLTGDKGSVEQLLKAVGLFTPDIQSHSPFLLLVNDRTGDWTRMNALETSPTKVAELLRQMAETAGNHNAKPDVERTSAENLDPLELSTVRR